MYLQIAFILVTASYVSSFGQGSVEQAPDGGSGTIKFGPPDLSDEMASSFFVPDNLKCDACRAIAYQVRFVASFFVLVSRGIGLPVTRVPPHIRLFL